MTVMEHALKQAGIKPKPLAERLWLYIKDHPNSLLADLEKIYGPTTKQLLHSMAEPKMLLRHKEMRRTRDGFDRMVWIYKVAMKDYEWMPAPFKAPKPKPAPVAQQPLFQPSFPPAPPVPAVPEKPMLVQVAPAPARTLSDSLDDFIANMPVSEAVMLHSKLLKIFQPR